VDIWRQIVAGKRTVGEIIAAIGNRCTGLREGWEAEVWDFIAQLNGAGLVRVESE